MIKRKCFFRARAGELLYMFVISASDIYIFYDLIVDYERVNNAEYIHMSPL